MTKTTITPEIGWELVKAYTTELPQPSTRTLATRFGLSPASVQRYLKKNMALVTQPTQTEEAAKIRLEVAPQAIREVRELSKDLAVNKLQRVLAETEAQYESLREANPTLAGAYLREMRQTLETMGKWLGIDGNALATVNTVDASVSPDADPRCAKCPYNSIAAKERDFLDYHEAQDRAKAAGIPFVPPAHISPERLKSLAEFDRYFEEIDRARAEDETKAEEKATDPGAGQ